MSVMHILPCQDYIEHEDEGTGCPCGPDVEWVIGMGGAHGQIVVHHSLDGRELEECDCGEAG